MPQKLNERELAEFGITTNHERMENGEVRFRLTGRDGSSYIRCENTGGPVWENSHSHSALREMVIVQEGRVVFAEYREGTARLRELPPGGWAVTVPGVPHNECLARGTVVHTVKCCGGACKARRKRRQANSGADAGYRRQISFHQAFCSGRELICSRAQELTQR